MKNVKNNLIDKYKNWRDQIDESHWCWNQDGFPMCFCEKDPIPIIKISLQENCWNNKIVTKIEGLQHFFKNVDSEFGKPATNFLELKGFGQYRMRLENPGKKGDQKEKVVYISGDRVEEVGLLLNHRLKIDKRQILS